MSNYLDGKELWRQIPPEEKIELLSRAHSVGVMAALTTIVIASAIAVGLQLKWFLWGSILTSPLIFQFAAGRAWRSLRPRILLEYLGVRSAARRFAFTAKAKDLTLRLVFKGKIEEVFETEGSQEALEAAIDNTNQAAVWIALFEDAVVMLAENPGGAIAKFAQPITDRFKMDVVNRSDRDYSADKEIYLSYESPMLGQRKVKLTSPYPAAMVVFEKAVQQRIQQAKEKAALLKLPIPDAEPEEAAEEEY